MSDSEVVRLPGQQHTTSDPQAEIRHEAQRIYESALYSSETQFEYAKRWRRVDRWLGGTAALVAAVAGVGGLSDVFTAKGAGLAAIAAAGMGGVAATMGASRTKEKAAHAAMAMRALQQDVRIFINIDLDQLELGAARKRLQELVDRLQQLSAETEIPSFGAWKRARKSVEQGAQDYATDK